MNRNSKKRQGTRTGRETTTGIGTGTAREHILPWVRTFFEIKNKNDWKKSIKTGIMHKTFNQNYKFHCFIFEYTLLTCKNA